MTRTLAEIWRHPIKSHGRESLSDVFLEAGKTMPWDRAWAIAHESAKTDGLDWAPCANFSRVAKAPELMAINAEFDASTETVTLTHPRREPLTCHPEKNADKLLDWVMPLVPADRALPARIIRVPERGMTDTDFPSISINNKSSHRAVEQRVGQPLDIRRWRGNLWLDGLGPWEEFEWVGKSIRIGEVEFRVEERIQRCLATTANPETGKRDVDTLGALQSWDHQDFGIYAVVTQSGKIQVGDHVEIG